MLTEAELAGLYTACDCFVQPHRAASFNLAALEAMACGRPIITTDFGGVRDFAGKENSYLIPAKTTRYRPGKVGHWTVRGEQLHAEVDQKAVAERLRHVFQHATEAQKLGARGGEFVRENFTWKKSADRVLDRMRAVLSAEDRRTKPVRTVAASADTPTTNANGPTVVIYAPFYNRSGYGVAARALASALHAAGLKIRIMPVDNVEEGIDDCDLTLLHSLEKTPLTSAVVAVFFHVASPAWLKIALPPQSARILFTTFDGTAQGLKPPAEWVSVCNQMDQLWLQTEKEAAVFASAGVAADKIHALKCPHPWISNPSLPDAQPRNAGAKFRFLSIAMFQPRRRWDTLLEAFLTEFKETPDAELYLKVNYPLWHPVPGQPAKDLRHLIETLRQKTGSNASVILDEELGTRAGICRLIDSCDAYASTDTTLTAPVGEAFVRAKIAIIPDGYGADLPYCEGALIIPIDPKLVGPMTEEMLQYQPHHRGREMPLLRVEDVRQALRAAYELPESQRHEMGRLSALVMDCKYGPTYVTPAYLKAIDRAVKDKLAGTERAMPVSWEGPFLDYGSLSFVNRALTSALTLAAKLKLSLVGNASLTDSALRDDALQALAKRIQPKAPNNAEITVRHQWPPDWRRPKQGKLVVIQPWEYGILPVDWVQKSADVDEFWAYTHYVRQVYISSGIDAAKVKIVPLGIDPGVFRPDASPRTLSTAKRFKFLFVGGTIYRKGPDILLAAYLDHFTADDDVCLVIKDFGGKSVYAGQTLESQIKAAQLKPNAPEILYLNEELLPSELPALYTACDCFVHPYRGEGFGLPILEAMACGLPVIVTAGGSADDFATDEFAYRIPATRKSIGDNLSGMKLAGSGWVLEPDVTALSRRMRWVATHREEARLLGMRAANYTRRHWTWERAASIAEGYLQNLAHLREHSPSTKITNTPKITVLPAPAVAEIGSLVQAQELFRKKSPRSAWESASEAIRMRPHHPDASLLLAEIARMIGDSENARRCAQHALSLAPNSKPAKKFLQGNFNGTTRPEWLILPPGIELHENKIPGRGRLSVCLIVKDEERFIGQCLASVKGLADQIVVVDTGSTDQTKTIAQEKRAEVHSFPWNDDFSAARNEALAHANGDWVLFLDADEELPAENHAAFRAMLANESAMSWRMPILDAGHEEKGHRYMVRLFRNAPGLHFVGRVHEQIFPSIEIRRKEGGLENRIADVALRHHGYTPELIAERGKTQRNLRWLEKALSETPGDPTLLTNQGLELSRDGRIDEGLRRYQTACEILAAHPSSSIAPESRQVLLSQYSAQLISAGKPREAITLLTSSIARQAEPTASLHFQLGLAYMEIRDFPAGAQQMRHCLAKRELTTLNQVNPATRGIKPRHHLAVCLWQSNERDAADSEFQIASTESSRDAELHLDYAKFLEQIGRPGDALQLLHRIAMEKPEVAEIWQFGGAITLKHDELIGVALEWTDVAIQNLPDNEDLFRLRAEALLLNGDFDQSLTFWTRLNPAAHISVAAGIVTCETMLGTNQFDPPPAMQKAASDQFMTWYWRFVQNGAEPIVLKLLDQVDSLEARLPEAGTILRSIIKKLSIPATT
ncbi:MAG: glycosyltransferase [Lacunisphaera sp.]